jgi:hypothetical protein
MSEVEGRMAAKWIRFFSPGSDPRPVLVPAPCEWWCSGYTADDRSIICALIRVRGDSVPWGELETWWPGLAPDSEQTVPDEYQPSDRFPREAPGPKTFDPELLLRPAEEPR